EPTKYITGEERELNFLDPVRPNTPGLILREEPFIAFTSEDCCNAILALTPDSDRKPRKILVPRLHSISSNFWTGYRPLSPKPLPYKANQLHPAGPPFLRPGEPSFPAIKLRHHVLHATCQEA